MLMTPAKGRSSIKEVNDWTYLRQTGSFASLGCAQTTLTQD